MTSTPRESSQTALTAAAARAAHVIVDQPPVIFADSLAEALLGDQAGPLIAYHRAHGDHLVLATARAHAVCRSRYAEDQVAAALERGVRQYVILGAGLDSFAYRAAPAGLRIFEVDHPASQQHKRERLAAARIPVPDHVVHVPLDVELAAGTLIATLVEHGFDPGRAAIVSCLGVTFYLTPEAVEQTLAQLSRCAPGTQIVLDYLLPAPLRDQAGQTYVELVAPLAAEQGEPWLSAFAPDQLAARLDRQGFDLIEHVQLSELLAQHGPRTDALRPARLTSLARARVRAHA